MKRVMEDRPLTAAERHLRWAEKPGKREARREYRRNWAAANPDKIAASRERGKPQRKAQRSQPEVKARDRVRERNRYRVPGRRAERMCCSARARAKKFGIAFDITPADVLALLAVGACPYTGVSFDYAPPAKGLRKNPWSPSLDQINPRKGYTRDNIEVVSTWWNIAKNEWPLEVTQAAIQGLVSKASSPQMPSAPGEP